MADYRALLSTLDHLYGAALEPSAWPTFLKAAAALFRADNAFVCQEENRRYLFDYISSGNRNRDLAPVSRYEALMTTDPRRRAFDTLAGRPITCRMVVSTHDLHASRAYAEYLKFLDIEYTMVVSVPVRPGFTHDLGLTRGAAGDPFDAADCDLLNELVPHLTRAFAIRRAMQGSGALPRDGTATPSPPTAKGEFERIRQRYALPPSQARLALAISSGRTVREAAAELGITEASARQYMKRIFDATGVRRQADLVRVVGQALG